MAALQVKFLEEELDTGFKIKIGQQMTCTVKRNLHD